MTPWIRPSAVVAMDEDGNRLILSYAGGGGNVLEFLRQGSHVVAELIARSPQGPDVFMRFPEVGDEGGEEYL